MTSPFHCVQIGSISVGTDLPLALIAGPCALESREHAMEMAARLVALTAKLSIPFVFKTSYDKANRTSLTSGRGVGFKKALPIFEEIRSTYGCPVVTDVHESYQCAPVAQVVDVLQIPAYLCRQTDLLTAAAKTQKSILIKKGQFLAPWDMKHVLGKITENGNRNVLLCERGACFGYNTLVSDMRSLAILAQTGYPTVFDATHSVQTPGGRGSSSGGERQFVELLARAAVSVGIAGLFIETHDNPDIAPSDGHNMIPLANLEPLLKHLQELDILAKRRPLPAAFPQTASTQR